tara:strand:+ start:428 stop:1222 length:795 start_codon:yes stop_codon:yes gene_type:complete
MEQSIAGIILAAGKGTRMRSQIPKVLHKIKDLTLLEWVILSLKDAAIQDLAIVLGGDIGAFKEITERHSGTRVCIQKKRKGTGDAVASAAAAFNISCEIPYTESELIRGKKISSEYCLICAGDTPLVPSSIIKDFIQTTVAESAPLSLIGMTNPNPEGYGRLVTKRNKLIKIVEEKDADEETKKIQLCNSGVILAKTSLLFKLLAEIRPNNKQEEYYLTDCFEIAQKQGIEIKVFETEQFEVFQGINTKEQLNIARKWMEKNQT